MKWIKCSERMPEADVSVLALRNGQPLVLHWFSLTEMWDDGGFLSLIELDEVTHWMPLPQPPEDEVKSALEIGMSRYAGAMQKLAEGGD